MSLPTLSHQKRKAVLRTPYDPAFVEDLKRSIPRVQREWDADRKVWRVDKRAAPVARDVMLRWFPEILVVGDGDRDYVLDRTGTMTDQPSLFG